MFCPNCGNQLNPGARFCGKCGTPIEPDAGADPFFSTSAQVQPQQQYTQPQQQYTQPQQQYTQPQYSQPYYSQQNYTQPTYRGRAAGVSPKYVGFVEAVKLFFINWLDYEGRSTRSEYWWAVLFRILISIPFGLIGKAAESPIPALLITAVLFIPSFTVLLRRLHDTGRDGTAVVVLYALLLVEFVVGLISTLAITGLDSSSSLTEIYSGLAASFAGLLLMFIADIVIIGVGIYVIVITCQESQRTPNKYGRAPQ